MLEALQTGDWNTVWDVWKLALPFEDLRAKYNNGNNVVVIKEALEQLGFPAGVVRPPVSELNETDKEAVTSILKSWGLSKLANHV
jgi:4-hydroxy-tetrahydrodipicolinate synthase